MSAVKITDQIYAVGILNPALRVFDIVMETAYGTSYNSYVVKGAQKNALIESCHKTFLPQYIDNIREVIDPAEIDYIVLNHNEPDHSGCLKDILEFCPKATIVVSQAGSVYLKNILNNTEPLRIQVARDGDMIDLGGRTLRFIPAPFLHWPDSMFTWVEEEKTLFSCDFLGAHYCEPYTFDYSMAYPEKYEEGFTGYYNAIFAPFKPYVLAGLEKMKPLDVQIVCPSHGPVLTKGGRLEYAIERYREWSQPQTRDTLLVPIFYTSAYGNTEIIADAIKDGILQVKPQAEIKLYDIIRHDMGELSALLHESSAFALGSPTINGDAVPPVWQLLSHVDALNNRKKPVLVFGSYGWSGEAVPNLTARVAGLKMQPFGEGLKICFVPSEADIEKACAMGKAFGETLA